MSAAERPTRWSAAAGGALPSSLVAGLSIQRGLGPDAATRDRMWERLEAGIALPPMAAAPSVQRAPRLGLGAVLLLAIAGGIALRIALHGTPAPPAGRSRRAGEPKQQAGQPSEPRNASPAEKRLEAAPTAAALPSLTLMSESAPAPKLVASRHPSAKPLALARTATALPEPAASPNDPGAELDLLSRARRVLRADPARALALTAEHSKRYPQGTFVQEREVLAIDALRRLGRDVAASERGARFHRDHPLSAHAARIDDILHAR